MNTEYARAFGVKTTAQSNNATMDNDRLLRCGDMEDEVLSALDLLADRKLKTAGYVDIAPESLAECGQVQSGLRLEPRGA